MSSKVERLEKRVDELTHCNSSNTDKDRFGRQAIHELTETEKDLLYDAILAAEQAKASEWTDANLTLTVEQQAVVAKVHRRTDELEAIETAEKQLAKTSGETLKSAGTAN